LQPNSGCLTLKAAHSLCAAFLSGSFPTGARSSKYPTKACTCRAAISA
jgi:hypothetical protein